MKKIILLKICACMGIGYIVSYFLINNIFIAKSPKLRSHLVTYLVSNITDSMAKIEFFKPGSIRQDVPPNRQKAVVSNASPQNIKKTLEVIKFNKTGSGIYQKDDGNFVHILIKEQEVNWSEYRVGSGKTNVRFPKGEEAPDKTTLKSILP